MRGGPVLLDMLSIGSRGWDLVSNLVLDLGRPETLRLIDIVGSFQSQALRIRISSSQGHFEERPVFSVPARNFVTAQPELYFSRLWKDPGFQEPARWEDELGLHHLLCILLDDQFKTLQIMLTAQQFQHQLVGAQQNMSRAKLSPRNLSFRR